MAITMGQLSRCCAVGLASLALTVFSAVPTYANYYSIGTFNNGNGYGGGYVQADIEFTYAPDCSVGGHTNETLWATTDSSPSYWAEIGWTHGYHGSCGFYIYDAYNNTVNGYMDFNLGNPPPIGTYHSFEVQTVSGSEYDMYLDNVQLGADINGHPWTTYVDVGLEQTAASGTGVNSTNFD